MARHLFTSESVTEGHPDKICDQISDSILDALLENDPHARVACETTVTTGLVLVAGEISTNTYVDIPKLVRKTVKEIGYDRAKYGFDCDTCAVITSIDEQSGDIAMGVDEALENKKGEVVQKTDVHTHMLRGTFATRCAEAKIAPAVLKKILGHSDITITMQYYVDVDSEFENSENKNVEAYLIGKEIFGVDFSTEDKSA